MGRSLRIFALLVGLLLGPDVLAQGRMITEDSLLLRLARYPALQARREASQAAARRAEQVSWPFPMVDLSLMPAMLAEGMSGFSVMMRQAIPWSDRLRAQKQAYGFEAEAATKAEAALQRQLRMEARMVLVELWKLTEQERRIRGFEETLRLFEEAALAQYTAARGMQAAVLRAGLERQLWAQRRLALREQMAEKRARLWELTGLFVAEADSLLLPALPDSFPVPRRALEEHPMYRERLFMARAEEEMLRMQRTMRRPDLAIALGVNATPEARRRLFGWEPLMPTVSLMLPLWRGPLKAREAELEARIQERFQEAASVLLQLQTRARAIASADAELRRQESRLEQELLPQARLVLEAVLSSYRVGQVPFVELLDAYRMLTELELELISARAERARLRAQWLELVESGEEP
jgi:cobalt-zinc-cadmium efflux system outer membrane protein